MAREIRATVKERAEEIVAMCNAPENRAAFEAYSAEMAYWRAKREEREREEAKAQ